MPLFSLEDELINWWKSLGEGINRDFEVHTGIVLSSLPDLDSRLTAIREYIGIKRRQFESEKEEEGIRRDQEFQFNLAKTQVHALGVLLQEGLTRSAQMMADYGKDNLRLIEGILKSVEERYVALHSTQQALLPSQIPYSLPAPLSYTNCIRHHSPTQEFPAGRQGPERCVYTIPQEDGLHMRCLIAYTSQNPGDKGFARLPYQIFHAELLRQGNCPRPLSRSVTRRIPGLSWLFVKPDVCPLASGEEIIIDYRKK